MKSASPDHRGRLRQSSRIAARCKKRCNFIQRVRAVGAGRNQRSAFSRRKCGQRGSSAIFICPGQASNNRRFSREIKRFHKRRCKKRCNRPDVGRTTGGLEQFAAGHKVGNPCGGATAPGGWVNQTSISIRRIFLITRTGFLENRQFAVMRMAIVMNTNSSITHSPVAGAAWLF
jgi:hypothetical protein